MIWRIAHTSRITELVCASVNSSILGTICLLEPKCYLSVYKSIAKEIFHGGTVPQFDEGVELGFGCDTPRKSSVLSKICLLEPKCYLSPFTSQSQKKFCMGGTIPQFGIGVELGVGCGTPRKPSVLGKICLLEPKRYLSPLTSQSQNKIWLGGTVPQFGRGVELGGRVWYTVKLLHIIYNLFAATEMLSLSVYEPIAIQI